MRRNRHKQVRKALRFYKINHGFKVPFKVLVDGNFVNALLELKRGEVQDLVPQFLGEKCRVFTTRCCVNELRKLGLTGTSQLGAGVAAVLCLPAAASVHQSLHRRSEDRPLKEADAIRATKLLAIHHCGHESAATPSSDCLLQQISQDNNANHFFVASQDRTLQRKVSNSPGGAVLFATVNGIQMEMPSERQKQQMMKTAEERQLHMGEMERLLVEDGGRGGRGGRGGQGPRESNVRRKKAKGPNPLSIKRRKPDGGAADGGGLPKGGQAAETAETAETAEATVKRKRQRKSRGGHVEFP